MRLHPLACTFALSILLTACSPGDGEGARQAAPASGSALPSVRVPGVLPGSGSRTEFRAPLPGHVTPSFEYTIVAEVGVGPGQRHTSLETPLAAREAAKRMLEDFVQAGLVEALPVTEHRDRHGVLKAYVAGVDVAGSTQQNRHHVGITASDREGQPALLMLRVTEPVVP